MLRSSRPEEIWPLRVEVELLKVDKKLPKKSFAVIPGIRQIAKSRLEERQGSITKKSLDKISTAVIEYLQD